MGRDRFTIGLHSLAGTGRMVEFFGEGRGRAAASGDEIVDSSGDASGLGVGGGTRENPDGKIAVPFPAGDFATDNFEGFAGGSFGGEWKFVTEDDGDAVVVFAVIADTETVGVF